MHEKDFVDFLLDKLAREFSDGVDKVEVKDSSFISYQVIKRLSSEGFKVNVSSKPEVSMVIF